MTNIGIRVCYSILIIVVHLQVVVLHMNALVLMQLVLRTFQTGRSVTLYICDSNFKGVFSFLFSHHVIFV